MTTMCWMCWRSMCMINALYNCCQGIQNAKINYDNYFMLNGFLRSLAGIGENKGGLFWGANKKYYIFSDFLSKWVTTNQQPTHLMPNNINLTSTFY